MSGSFTAMAYVRRAWCLANCRTGNFPPVIDSVVLNSAFVEYWLKSTRDTTSIKSLWSWNPVTMNTTTSPETPLVSSGSDVSVNV